MGQPLRQARDLARSTKAWPDRADCHCSEAWPGPRLGFQALGKQGGPRALPTRWARVGLAARAPCPMVPHGERSMARPAAMRAWGDRWYARAERRCSPKRWEAAADRPGEALQRAVSDVVARRQEPVVQERLAELAIAGEPLAATRRLRLRSTTAGKCCQPVEPCSSPSAGSLGEAGSRQADHPHWAARGQRRPAPRQGGFRPTLPQPALLRRTTSDTRGNGTSGPPWPAFHLA